MAKMQRWRRSRSAGEGTGPVMEYDAVDPAVEEAGVDPDSAPAAEAQGEPDAGPDLDSHDPDPGPGDPDLDPGDADDKTYASDDPATLDEGAPPAVRPELPHVPERSGLTSRMLGGRSPAEVLPLQLLQAAHAKQAIGTALAVALVAAVAGRPAREAGVVLLTVLVGQTILGWHNDIVDRARDQAHDLPGKPLAAGRLDPGTLWYAIIVATLILVPLSITTGIRAGCIYLAAVAVGMLGNVLLRTGFFSWWSWAVSFALLPAYVSYGGWGGQAVGSPPEPVIVGLAALLGVGIHFMRAVWGLVADHEDGWTYLPLKLGLKLGATRLLALSTVFSVLVAIALAVAGSRVGLSR